MMMQLSPAFLALLAFVISANAGSIPSGASLQAREPLADLAAVEDLYIREVGDELYARGLDLELGERDLFDDDFQLERRDPPKNVPGSVPQIPNAPQAPNMPNLPNVPNVNGKGKGRNMQETINYSTGPNGQWTETIDETIGRPGGKFKENIKETITGCVPSSFISFWLYGGALTIFFYRNKNKPGQFNMKETVTMEKDRSRNGSPPAVSAAPASANKKLQETNKNRPTNIKKNKRSFEDFDLRERELDNFDLEGRDFSETINYQMGPNGQYTETVGKKMGRPGGKFQETVNEVIKGYVNSWFAKLESYLSLLSIDRNKNRPSQYTETKNVEKDWKNKQGKKTQENVKINESVKNGKPTNFRETMNVKKNKRALYDIYDDLD
jgi:hypothetical protein